MRDFDSPPLARVLDEGPLLEDTVVRSLSPAARRQLGQRWQCRAENELRTSSGFCQLDAELRRFGAPEDVLILTAAAIDDEARHAELCRRISEIYAGHPVSLTVPSDLPPPVFAVCAPRVHQALFAALHSAINETLAVTYLAACLAEARAEAARRVLKSLLADEVRHARIGWAVLASPRLDRQDRELIANFMPALLDVCVGTWLADNQTDYPDDLPLGHGCIHHAAIARSVDGALTDVIIPGLEHVAIDVAPAKRWLAARPR
jgi:hypothetical protein